MAKTEPHGKSERAGRRTIWDWLDRLLVVNTIPEEWETEEPDEDEEFRLKPGWTIKG